MQNPAKAPAAQQPSEFDPQCKLDLPVGYPTAVLSPACARLQRFRERGQVRSATREYTGAQVIAAEVVDGSELKNSARTPACRLLQKP